MGMETMLQDTALSRVKQMASGRFAQSTPDCGPPGAAKPLTVLAASWDEMVETMKKEGLTPLRPLAVTTIYTEAFPDDPHFRRETVSFYGFRPIALLPELLNPDARKAVMRQRRCALSYGRGELGFHWMEHNRKTGISMRGAIPVLKVPDLDVHTWITYLVDRHSEGKTEKEVVTRELRFLVRAGEMQRLAVKP